MIKPLRMENLLISTDIALLSIISILPKLSLSATEALVVGSFVADNVTMRGGKCSQHENLTSYLQRLKNSLSVDSFSYFEKATHVKSVDACMDLFAATRTLFEHDGMTSTNRANVPQVIKKDSMVGLFVRACCAKWAALSFSSIGEVFEKYLIFCGDVFGEIVPPILHSKTAPPVFEDSKMQHYISAAENALRDCDTFSALNFIHLYFDYLDSLPSSASPIPRVMRQQEAMLSLATMWIRSDQFSQAIIATEEGMRMAHQLGDHTSVARALLLLHHIVDRLPEINKESSSGTPTVESVLIRCIRRCTELNLRVFEAQAILLFVRLRGKGPLQNDGTRLQLCGGISHVLENVPPHFLSKKNDLMTLSPDSKVSPCVLWALISSALLMESLYSRGVQSRNHYLPHKAADFHDKSCNDVELRSIIESIGYASVVSVELWDRLGIYSMSSLCCRRALRQCGSYLSAEMIVFLCSFLTNTLSKSLSTGAMVTKSHILLFNVSDKYNSRKQDVFKRSCLAETLQLKLKGLFSSKEKSDCCISLIKSVLCLIKVRKALYTSNLRVEKNARGILNLCFKSPLTMSEANIAQFFNHEYISMKSFLFILYRKQLLQKCLKVGDGDRRRENTSIADTKMFSAIADLFHGPENLLEALSNLLETFEHSKKFYSPQCDASLSVVLEAFGIEASPLLTYIHSKE